MRVEDHGYWLSVSINVEQAIKDPQIQGLFSVSVAPDGEALIKAVQDVIFEHAPAEHLTLIDAANIISMSGYRSKGQQASTLPAEQALVQQAAKAYSYDVASAIMTAYAMFVASGLHSFSDYVREEYRVTPCGLTLDGKQESVFVLTLWLSHYNEIKDDVSGPITFGAVAIPSGYGQGFCFPKLRRFVIEDARLRKKIPSLVGASVAEVEAYLHRMQKDII